MNGLSNGGRSVILETLKKCKESKTIMLTDYEVLVNAISKIPAKPLMLNLEKESNNYEHLATRTTKKHYEGTKQTLK